MTVCIVESWWDYSENVRVLMLSVTSKKYRCQCWLLQ